jgi:hypothetical protein
MARVTEGSTGITDRVDAIEQELTSLLDQLRQGANRLTSYLALLDEDMAVLRAPSGAGPAAGDDAETPPAWTPEPEPALTDTDALAEAQATEVVEVGSAEAEVIEVDAEVADTAEPVEPVTEPQPAAAAGGAAEDDAEGARLVALNMALNGTPREETDQYLAEHFELDDRTALLDEVYATVGE